MPKYLFEARYTAEGAKGVAKEGATSRREAVKKHLEQLGGKLDAMYFAFGDVDCYSIVNLPDNVSAAALSFAVNESGAIATRTVVLLTPEEVDAALRKKVARPAAEAGALPPCGPFMLWRARSRARSSTG